MDSIKFTTSLESFAPKAVQAAASPGHTGHGRKFPNARRINAMNAPLKAVAGSGKRGADLATTMRDIGREARAAARALALAPAAQKNRALAAMAKAIRNSRAAILAANADDRAEAKSAGATPAFLDRLSLDAERVEAMATALEVIRKLKDPVGTILASWRRPNGMRIERVRVPLGVVGVIYESRPNVTADAGALCLKSGNAAILRGGSESFRSCRAIHAALVRGLVEAGLPASSIALVPTRERDAVGMMLAGLDGAIDVIVPRGGKDLVDRVQTEARVPVFAHLEGVCHVYVDGKARLAMAKSIVLNAKMRRTGVCGAAETLLVDRAGAAKLLKPLVAMLLDAGCEIRGDTAVQSADSRVKPAKEADWSTEYLDAIMTAGVVDGVDAAIAHIERYGSHHTDAIVTEDKAAAEKFLREVDSAIVLHNVSTQFADGGEFGFGAEIGIATGRLHARGPVGVEQLTSFNYRIRGSGQTRP
jgi:glutamate-5-semialdehyde dehydrogenase